MPKRTTRSSAKRLGRPDQPPPRLRRSAVASAKAEGLRYDSKSTQAVAGARKAAAVAAQVSRAASLRSSKAVVAQPFRAADSLRGRVAVVAGATRGAGRGIARALG